MVRKRTESERLRDNMPEREKRFERLRDNLSKGGKVSKRAWGCYINDVNKKQKIISSLVL